MTAKKASGSGPARLHRATGNRPGPETKYRPEYVEQVRKLCAIGAIDEEIADFFKVSRRTITAWKMRYPDFLEALKLGKSAVDDRVERSLLQMALGYEQDEVKIFMPAGADEPVYAPYRAKIAPSPTAAIFFLKNRRPDLWRDVHRQEVTGQDGGPIQMEQVNADANAFTSAIASLAARTTEGGGTSEA